jgi:hypothetical protein
VAVAAVKFQQQKKSASSDNMYTIISWQVTRIDLEYQSFSSEGRKSFLMFRHGTKKGEIRHF